MSCAHWSEKALKLVGDPYWVNHVGMFTVPFHFAARFNIPLVIYGENPQFEYGGPEESRNNFIMDKRWRQEFGGMRGLREEDMSDYDISIEDLRILQYPDDELVQRLKIKGLFYGFFFKWNAIEHTEKMKKIGWKPLNQPPPGSYSSHENCDMQFIDIREHVKFLKYGYGRASDQLNIEIRQGLITRAEALSIANEIDGRVNEANIDAFCKFLDISTEEYNNIVDSFVNTEIFERGHNGNWTLKIKRS